MCAHNTHLTCSSKMNRGRISPNTQCEFTILPSSRIVPPDSRRRAVTCSDSFFQSVSHLHPTEGVNERRPLLRVRGGPPRLKIAGDFDLVLQGHGSPTPSSVFSKPKSPRGGDAFLLGVQMFVKRVQRSTGGVLSKQRHVDFAFPRCLNRSHLKAERRFPNTCGW